MFCKNALVIINKVIKKKKKTSSTAVRAMLHVAQKIQQQKLSLSCQLFYLYECVFMFMYKSECTQINWTKDQRLKSRKKKTLKQYKYAKNLQSNPYSKASE